MGRAKLPIKRIVADKNRRITFKKRSQGLKKKASEFATLCDVTMCMICLGPTGQQHFSPVTWPEEPQQLQQVIDEYQSRSVEERRKRMAGLSDYLREQMTRTHQELDRCKKENKELMYPSWDSRLDDSSEDFLRELEHNLDLKLDMVKKKINSMGKQIIQADINNPAWSSHQSHINHVPHVKQTNYLMDMAMGMHENKAEIEFPNPISYVEPNFSYTSMLANTPPDSNISSLANLSNYVNMPNISNSMNYMNKFRDISLPPLEGPHNNRYNVYGTPINYNLSYQNYSVKPLHGSSGHQVFSTSGSVPPSPSEFFLPQQLPGYQQSVNQFPQINQLDDRLCTWNPADVKYLRGI